MKQKKITVKYKTNETDVYIFLKRVVMKTNYCKLLFFFFSLKLFFVDNVLQSNRIRCKLRD